MRKPDCCLCENKDADQLRGNREADQRLCFCYIDSPIPLLSEYKISSLYPSCVLVEPGLCGSWSETPKTGFLIYGHGGHLGYGLGSFIYTLVLPRRLHIKLTSSPKGNDRSPESHYKSMRTV